MSNPIRPNSMADGETIDALRINEDFDTIYDWASTDAMHRDGSTDLSALPSGPGGGVVPTQDAQLANKLYVDNAVDAVDTFTWLGSGGPGANGLLIRSGLVLGSAGAATTAVTFGATFPNACLTVMLTPVESTELIQVSLQGVPSKTGFTAKHVLRTGDPVPGGVQPQFRWLAIGY